MGKRAAECRMNCTRRYTLNESFLLCHSCNILNEMLFAVRQCFRGSKQNCSWVVRKGARFLATTIIISGYSIDLIISDLARIKVGRRMSAVWRKVTCKWVLFPERHLRNREMWMTLRIQSLPDALGHCHEGKTCEAFVKELVDCGWEGLHTTRQRIGLFTLEVNQQNNSKHSQPGEDQVCWLRRRKGYVQVQTFSPLFHSLTRIIDEAIVLRSVEPPCHIGMLVSLK